MAAAAAAVAAAPPKGNVAVTTAVAIATDEAPLVAPASAVASAAAADADKVPLVAAPCAAATGCAAGASPRGSPSKRTASEAGGGRSPSAAAAKAARLSALAAAGAAAAAAAAATARQPKSPTTPTKPVAGKQAEAESPVKDKRPVCKEVLPWERTLKEELKRSTSNLSTHMDHRRKFKDGQRFPTPPVAEATRAFYESLIEENPDSKIAIKYCVEYGVLPVEEHKKAYKKYKKLREKGSFSTSAMIKKALQRKYDKTNSKAEEPAKKNKQQKQR